MHVWISALDDYKASCVCLYVQYINVHMHVFVHTKLLPPVIIITYRCKGENAMSIIVISLAS